MKKVLLFTFIGFAFIVGGFILGFLYVDQASYMDPNPLYLVGILGCLGIGVFILTKAGTQDIFKPHFKEPVPGTVPAESILEKNDALVKDYYKTMESRDKLKILKTAGEAEAESENG